MSSINVMFVKSIGGGGVQVLNLASGTTLQEALRSQFPSTSNFTAFGARVNGNSVSLDTVLQDGDRVTYTPSKMENASATA